MAIKMYHLTMDGVMGMAGGEATGRAKAARA
jgi:hypothetical protein